MSRDSAWLPTAWRVALGMVVLVLMPTATAATVTAPLSSTVLITSPNGRLVDHSSTIVELATGEMLAAWMHGDYERGETPSTIFMARRSLAGVWSAASQVIAHPNRSIGNPILHVDDNNTVWLFYSIKNEAGIYYDATGTPKDGTIQNGWVGYRRSYDYGQTWGAPTLIRGRMNTPDRGWLTGSKPVMLANGNMLLPLYRDVSDVTLTDFVFHYADSAFVITGDGGSTWEESVLRKPAGFPGDDWMTMPAVQPSGSGLLAWFRTPSNVSSGKMFRATGTADGMTWNTPAIPSTSPNGAQARVDLVRLHSNAHVLIASGTGRNSMNLHYSTDGTATWTRQFTIESSPSGQKDANGWSLGIYSYPAIIQTRDGLIHAIYTFNGYNAIKHAVLSEPWFLGQATAYKPNVGITSPRHGDLLVGGTVTIQAGAVDRDGSVTKVEFFSGPTKLGEDLTAPYQYTGPFANGLHTVTARATDNAGQTLTSRPITFRVAAAAGALTGAVVARPRATSPMESLNLSTEGTLDWVHLGLGNNPTAINRKSGTPVIGMVTALSSLANPRASYTDSSLQVSWSGGTPTANVSNTRDGVFVNYAGTGFEFTVPADTSERTLRVHVNAYRCTGTIEARLSDGSAPIYRDSTLSNASSSTRGVYTLTYKASSAGQWLTVRWLQSNSLSTNSTPKLGSGTELGNVAVQAITLQGGAPGTVDTTPPAAISSLTVDGAATTTTSVALRWTAPGDDGTVGTAASYQVRYATSAIDSTTAWNGATAVVSGLPVPVAAGGTQTMTVGGLSPATTYHFSVRALDDVGLLGGLSNSPAATTAAAGGDTTAPAAITSLAVIGTPTASSITLSWTAPGDDGTVGTATTYQVRHATTAITNETAWNAATPVTSGVPTPGPAGSSQSLTLGGLTPATTYHVAVRALDEALNRGGLSNSVSATTASVSGPSATLLEDATARQSTPGVTNTNVNVKSNDRHAYLKFQVTGMTGQTVSALSLRLRESASASVGNTDFTVWTASSAWSEATLVWSNKPAALRQVGSVTVGQLTDNQVLDITLAPSAISGDGTLTLVLIPDTGTADSQFTSREENAGLSANLSITPGAPDNTPPATPAAPALSSATSPTPTLSGITEPFATVEVYEEQQLGDVLIGTTTADAAGQWSFTITPPLAAGIHVLYVRVRDPAANTSEPSPGATVTLASGGGGGAGSSGGGGGSCGMGGALAALLLWCWCLLSGLRSRE